MTSIKIAERFHFGQIISKMSPCKEYEFTDITNGDDSVETESEFLNAYLSLPGVNEII